MDWKYCFALISSIILTTSAKKVPILFNTKTPYKFIENDDTTIVKPNPQCVPIQINMVHRHAHRYPSKGDFEDFKEIAKKLNKATATISPSINLTLPWKPPYDKADSSRLTEVGEKELYGLGRRIQTRFPNIVGKYSSRFYSFISTNKLRTTHSSASLAAGLFHGRGSIGPNIQPIALEVTPKDPNDKMLRFYRACENFQTEIDDNEKVLVEYNKFGKGEEINKVTDNILTKLGNRNIGINYNDIVQLYDACAYEISLFNGTLDTGLCDLFDESDRTVAEYAGDLNKFYQFSNPKMELTYKISCPLLKDISDTLLKRSQNISELSGIFRSTHSSAMLMFYTLLGLNNQSEPLRHDNFAEQKDRDFRSSISSPFSTNAYFVLYDCEEERKIQLYWNERLRKIPCCHSEIDCDFKTFIQCYKDIVDGCSETFDDLCKPDQPSSAIAAYAKNNALFMIFFCLAISFFINIQ